MFALDDDSYSKGGGGLAREVEVGNVEYKLKLVGPSAARLQQLVTQLKYRLAEGRGEALYEIGVGDDGSLRGLGEGEMTASLETLSRMCAALGAQMSIVQRRVVPPGGRTVAEVLVRKLLEGSARPEVRIAFVGAGQAGKSTLVGVLATGQLDDGEGSARTMVMRHVHELESGATSSISQQVLGFDAAGALLNSADSDLPPTEAEVVEGASQLLTLLDLCGASPSFSPSVLLSVRPSILRTTSTVAVAVLRSPSSTRASLIWQVSPASSKPRCTA